MHDDLPIQIKHSKRAKRLALRLDVKERVINLVVPKGCSDHKAHAFALEHKEWIEEKLAELAPLVPFENGRIIPVLGKNRQILVRRDSRATDIFMDDDTILIRTNKAADPARRLTAHLKKLAQDELSALSHEKAALIDKKIKEVSVRDTKSRWGSCGVDKRLSYSWRLLLAPLPAMDYVVAHEVAHLVHLNHSAEFWALCEELSDDYEEGKYWMRQHGHELMRYGASGK